MYISFGVERKNTPKCTAKAALTGMHVLDVIQAFRNQQATVLLQHLQDTNQYVHNEMEALEREQTQIDKEAGDLESKLRKIMGKRESSPLKIDLACHLKP